MRTIKDTTKEFESGKILPLVFKLTIPAVIAQLITFIYNLVDRMYVSGLENIQSEALAALGVVLPLTMIIQAFANLIGLGASPKASMKLGEKDQATANKIFNNASVLLFIIGLVLTLIFFFFAEDILVLFGCPKDSLFYATEYLKIYALGTIFVIIVQGLNPFITATGHSIISMGTIALGAIINIILDPIFIYTLQLGVKGAAIATILSQMISFVWVISFFFLKGSNFKFSFKDMKLDFRLIGTFLFLGLSPFIMTITESAIQIVFTVSLKMSTGINSSEYVAALTVMLSALQLVSLPLNGLGFGIAPFVSYNYGKGDAYRIKKAIKYTFIIGFIFGSIFYIVSMSFPEIYAMIFNANESVYKLVKEYAPLFLMGTIMFTIQMTLQNINVALGQGKCAVILAVLRKVVILIPLCLILANTIGYKGVYMSEGIADLIAGVITGVVIFITFPKVINKRAEEVKKLVKVFRQNCFFIFIFF